MQYLRYFLRLNFLRRRLYRKNSQKMAPAKLISYTVLVFSRQESLHRITIHVAEITFSLNVGFNYSRNSSTRNITSLNSFKNNIGNIPTQTSTYLRVKYGNRRLNIYIHYDMFIRNIDSHIFVYMSCLICIIT